jgi:hypothetical protein
MYGARQVLWSLQFTLDEIGEFTFLPRFALLAHRFEIALHAIHTNRNAIDQRE